MDNLLASKRNNCLNLIRLLAALDVFYGHAIVNFDFARFAETIGRIGLKLKTKV